MSPEIATRHVVRSSPAVFRHTKCAQWGLATLQWDSGDKRCFRFEDGTERIFSSSFAHLLQPVDVPVPAGCADAPRPQLFAAVSDQIALWLESYPDGFVGQRWQVERRGEGASRRLKRHRDPAIAHAREILGREAVDERLAAGRFVEILDSVVDVLDNVDLVTRGELDSLRNCTASERLAIALREALHGEATIAERFDRLCRDLHAAGARASSWPLVTSVLALVFPGEHVCVRPTVLKAQSRILGRQHRLAASPTPIGYARYLELARHVGDVLREQGHAPADLLDVIDFVWLTMRPAATADLQRVAAIRIAATTHDANAGTTAAA